MRRLVLRNQVMVGSVNASRDHFQLAVNDLVLAQARWPQRVADLITHRHPYADFESAFQHHGSDEIKVVLEWGAESMKSDVRVCADVNELSRRAAEAAVRTINDAVRSHGRCSLVLSGGNTPRTLYGLLASEFRDQIPWTSGARVLGG